MKVNYIKMCANYKLRTECNRFNRTVFFYILKRNEIYKFYNVYIALKM